MLDSHYNTAMRRFFRLQPAYDLFSWDYWFGQVDSRPLALFRIVFSLLLLKDAVYHIFLAGVFYSDLGVVPRSTMLELVRQTRFSFMDAIGQDWLAGLFFVVWCIVLLGMLVGYRTRLMVILNFLIILSVHERNLWVLNGADTVMRVLSFWILFLPLGRYYSIDAIRLPDRSRTAFAFPLRMIQLQIALIYFFTFIMKFHGEMWRNGEAVYYSLQLQGFTHATGDWLVANVPYEFFQVNTYLTLFTEATFLFLVFMPILQPYLRILGLLLGTGLHFGIAIFMSVPNFSMVLIGSYLLFFQPEWLQWLERQFTKAYFPIPKITDAHLTKRRIVIVLFTGFMMFNVIGWNLWRMRPHGRPLGSQLSDIQTHLVQYLGLWQVWDMFSPNPSRGDSWMVVIGRFEDGREVDLRTLGDYTGERLRFLFGPDVRWKKFDENANVSGNTPLLEAWGSYYCRIYNIEGNLPDGEHLATLEIQLRSRATHAPSAPENEFSNNLRWKHWCYEQYAY